MEFEIGKKYKFIGEPGVNYMCGFKDWEVTVLPWDENELGPKELCMYGEGYVYGTYPGDRTGLYEPNTLHPLES